MQNYSCLTDELLTHPNLLFYSSDRYKRYVVPYASFLALFITVIGGLVIFASYRAASTKSMSERLKKQQRRFLHQLLCQSVIPYIIVLIPLFYIYHKIYTFSFSDYCERTDKCYSFFLDLTDIALCVFATYSTTSSLILVVMNKNYYGIVLKPMRKILKIKEDRKTTVISVLWWITQ